MTKEKAQLVADTADTAALAPPKGASPLDTHLLLAEARLGREQARRRLFDHLYSELQKVARRQLNRSVGKPLQTTELVHEAYLKMCQADRLSAGDRAHFFAIAASAMRQILVDRYRRDAAQKRGSAEKAVTLDEAQVALGNSSSVLALDEALSRFEALDGRAAKVVEMKFFAGLTEPDIAAALGVSVRTVSGDWRRARAWLNRELSA